MKDAERIAAALTNVPVVRRTRYGWFYPPLDVLDCVLSLNRRYDSFVVPRVERFAERHPNLTTLRGLARLIGSYQSPRAFSIAELQYRDGPRAVTLRGVVDYLLGEERRYAGATERARLRKWAQSVAPADYERVGVPGFGLAGFQYLRMLLGVQTTKPDICIKRFIGNAVGRSVSAVQAIELLEAGARAAKLRLRDADNAIWRQLARHPGSAA
jgi:hypothetical protein